LSPIIYLSLHAKKYKQEKKNKNWIKAREKTKNWSHWSWDCCPTIIPSCFIASFSCSCSIDE
jgi:hypothetical protein